MSEFESCTGCWYAEHGDCSLGDEPCHEKKPEFSEPNPMYPEIESNKCCFNASISFLEN